MADTTTVPSLQQALQGEDFIALTTYRKSGEGVATPVWFAQHGDKLYIMTVQNSGKVKRIRNNPQVSFAACDRAGKVHGTALYGTARILSPSEAEAADRALNRKYGWQKRMFDIGMGVTGTARNRVYLEVIGSGGGPTM